MEPLPKLRQIQNIVSHIGSKTNASNPITADSLRNFCKEKEQKPKDEHTPYVVAYSIENGEKFFVLISTPRLLRIQLGSNLIQV
jgi:hypothetical protein